MIRGVSKRPNVYLVLIFPDSTECRWAWEQPRIGSEINCSDGTKWRVEEVMRSGTKVYTVHCGPLSHGLTDLGADLLDRAREALSSSRRRRREYLP